MTDDPNCNIWDDRRRQMPGPELLGSEVNGLRRSSEKSRSRFDIRSEGCGCFRLWKKGMGDFQWIGCV